MNVSDLMPWVPVLGGVGLAVAGLIYMMVARAPAGNERMREISEAIHEGAMVFLRRGSLSVVTLDLDDELAELLAGADPVAGDLAIEEMIEVEFEDGLVLEGTTRFQLPEAQARIQDHLNGPEPFLQLYCGDRVHLINKACIARAIVR